MDWRTRLDQVNTAIGDYLRSFEGKIPTRVLLRLISAEGKRWGLSDDWVLCEVGWASVPLLTAYLHNVNPFDDRAAAWLAAHEAESDAVNYLEQFPDELTPHDPDLAWAVLLDYSIGTRAAELVIRAAVRSVPLPADCLMARALAWVQLGPHDEARELRYYGRQTCATVYARISKQVVRTRQAFDLPEEMDSRVRPFSAAPRPSDLPHFPSALRKAAKICRKAVATLEERHAAWETVRAYIARNGGR